MVWVSLVLRRAIDGGIVYRFDTLSVSHVRVKWIVYHQGPVVQSPIKLILGQREL